MVEIVKYSLRCPYISAPVIPQGPHSLDSKLLAKELRWVSLSNGVKLGHDVVGTGGLHRVFTCQVHARHVWSVTPGGKVMALATRLPANIVSLDSLIYE